MTLRRTAVLAALVFGTCSVALTTGVRAQSMDDTRRLIEELQRQVQVLKDRLDKQEAQQKAQAAQPPAAAPPAGVAGGHEFLERKPGNNMTFFTRGGEATFYGNLDISLDALTKGIAGKTCSTTADPNCAPHANPIGRVGYMSDLSTNISYFGLRGFQNVGKMPFDFVYQLETALDLTVSSGTVETNSNNSNVVRSGLTTRNTFIGLGSPTWGALKVGKTDTPYKTSTARMNPFSGMIGDYSAIMGNTGGDNRVEFGVPRMEHSIWYESPKVAGVSANVLFSPGQNRSYDSDNISSGSSDCAGGNAPGSGGTPACSDGAFSDAFSANVAYVGVKNLYVTAAYEMHRRVNRTSDIVDNTFTPYYDQGDVADESARKAGVQYQLPTKTTVSFIWEDLRRNVPSYLNYQNERQRTGYWFSVSQEITSADSIHFGWAHANAAVGDPGQHNAAGVDVTTSTNPQGVMLAGMGHVDNSANMFTAMARHRFDRNLSIYANWATTINHKYGHYDLGAGGRGVTTDCHDASNADGTGASINSGGPRCWAGGHLMGFSVGMNYRF